MGIYRLNTLEAMDKNQGAICPRCGKWHPLNTGWGCYCDQCVVEALVGFHGVSVWEDQGYVMHIVNPRMVV